MSVKNNYYGIVLQCYNLNHKKAYKHTMEFYRSVFGRRSFCLRTDRGMLKIPNIYIDVRTLSVILITLFPENLKKKGTFEFLSIYG